MKKTLLLLASLSLFSCGGALKGGTINFKPPVKAPPMRAVATVVVNEVGKPIVGAVCGLDGVTDMGVTSNKDGYVLFAVPNPFPDTQLVCKADGYEDFSEHRDLKDGNYDMPATVMRSLHKNPMEFSLAELAKIRGAMWPSATDCPGLLLPFGPRPNQQDNIIATDFLSGYSPDQQLAIVNCLTAQGYTHAVIGPIVDSDGYHGQFTPRDWRQNFDAFLDVAQFLYDHGLIPVIFIHPDGWSFEQTQELTHLFLSERAQRLMRIVVPTGWEPAKYEWSSCTWASYVTWARATWPNALVMIHTVSDVDAPAGTDALCNDDDHKWNPDGNAGAWRRVAPFIHGWLIQNGPYYSAPAADPNLARNFAAQFKVDGDGAALHSVAWHFAGNAGWPTNSAWGNSPVLLYNAESTAYSGYWNNLPEASRRAWGKLAIASGAAGCLDGCN